MVCLSKTKIIEENQCPKRRYLSEIGTKEVIDFQTRLLLAGGHDVEKVARELFFPNIKIVDREKSANHMICETNKLLSSPDTHWIGEASFGNSQLFASVDILEKLQNNKVAIIEIKTGKPKQQQFVDVAVQTYILEKCGYIVEKATIMYINSKYIHGVSKPTELFCFEECTEVTRELIDNGSIETLVGNAFIHSTTLDNRDIGPHCKVPQDCPYFAECSKHLPENSIFSIANLRWNKKWDLYGRGIISFEDVEMRGFDSLNKDMQQQVTMELHNSSCLVDKANIQKWLNTIQYPLVYIDFETIQDIVPRFYMAKPYEQIVTQVSLHIQMDENAPVIHLEYLAPNIIDDNGNLNDPRRGVAEFLAAEIPMQSCLMAYNASFEKGIICGLCETFPDLAPMLDWCETSFVDLMEPFKKRWVYDAKFKGKYSIKNILPVAFPNDPNMNYDNLTGVHNGEEAMMAFATIHLLPKEEQLKVRKELLEYCCLDTLAMVKLHRWLETLL